MQSRLSRHFVRFFGISFGNFGFNKKSFEISETILFLSYASETHLMTSQICR